ncbi:MAG: C1 family peptidase [Deltaproteobacteria bacterium]|nr:C1 family peptidase [Deltaproteobacteria bacterium]
MSDEIFITPDNYRLTAVPDSTDIRDRMYEPALIQLKSEIRPESNLLHVRDQKAEGACTGFGLAAVIDFLNKKRYRDVRVSPRMLYEMAKRHDEWPGEGYDGSSCRGAIRGWYGMGVCSEQSWPYEAGDDSVLSIESAKEARENTIGAYFRLRPNIVDFHAALNEVGVLYVSANVHRGWWRNSLVMQDGAKVIPYHSRTEGGHAFALVGYNNKGFWVQNSWGDDWGKQGVALWTYEDWQRNIRDAWVVRLALSTPQVFQRPMRGEEGQPGDQEGFFRAPNRSEIAGHFVHIDDGNFDNRGRYWSTRDDVKQTACLLGSTDKYQHVLLYAHGGLNSVKDSAKRVSAMKEVFKANSIYPYHFMYDTGLMEEIKDVLLRKRGKTEARVGAISDWWDKKVEQATRKPGRALWREMKLGAGRPFDPARAGSQVISDIVGAVRSNPNLKLHLAGHSTGAILMANLLGCAAREFDQVRIESISLLAPACTCDLFESHYRPHLNGETSVDIGDMSVYNLNENLELDDNVAQVYRKSLLYLVSRAFEDNTVAPILGMKKYSEAVEAQKLSFIYSEGDVEKTPRSASQSHGGFDNDIATMNDILHRILRVGPERLFTKQDLDY